MSVPLAPGDTVAGVVMLVMSQSEEMIACAGASASAASARKRPPPIVSATVAGARAGAARQAREVPEGPRAAPKPP